MADKRNKINLDDYENEILEAYENGKLKPSTAETDFQTVARNTMVKNRKINIRISENDLSAFFQFFCFFLRYFAVCQDEIGIK